MSLPISIADIRAAAERIRGFAIVTPLIESAPLSAITGRRTFVKFEGAQNAGAFKFRGAFNRLAALSETERAKGVVAWSSGNHAQGVAAAAGILKMPATIVMPADAPAIKLDNTRALGADVVTYDRFTQSREDIATELSQDRGATLVPSFDDAHVIAGQGTTGLEILDQLAAAGGTPGTILVCCGGGGLAAGVATAIKDGAPGADVFSVEPAAFDDTARSLESGEREVVDPAARSICDALLAPRPGALTFPINKALLAGGLSVSDDELQEAMRFAFVKLKLKLKLVAEPGGAVALAAALQGRAPRRDGDLVVVISGGNVDPQMFADILTA